MKFNQLTPCNNKGAPDSESHCGEIWKDDVIAYLPSYLLDGLRKRKRISVRVAGVLFCKRTGYAQNRSSKYYRYSTVISIKSLAFVQRLRLTWRQLQVYAPNSASLCSQRGVIAGIGYRRLICSSRTHVTSRRAVKPEETRAEDLYTK